MYDTNGMAPRYNRCIADKPYRQWVESTLTASSGKAARSPLPLLINITTMGGCDNTDECDCHFLHLKNVGDIQDYSSYNYHLLQKQCLPL